MAAWAGSGRTELWCRSTGSVATGTDTASGAADTGGRPGRPRRVSRAVVCRTAKRPACAAGLAGAVRPGGKGPHRRPEGPSASDRNPRGRRPLAGCVGRGPTGRVPKAAPITRCRRVDLASSSRTKPGTTAPIRDARPAPRTGNARRWSRARPTRPGTCSGNRRAASAGCSAACSGRLVSRAGMCSGARDPGAVIFRGNQPSHAADQPHEGSLRGGRRAGPRPHRRVPVRDRRHGGARHGGADRRAGAAAGHPSRRRCSPALPHSRPCSRASWAAALRRARRCSP